MLHIIDGNNRFRARWEKLGPDALQMLYNFSISTLHTHKVIWVWDGEGSLSNRKEIFPEYKGLKKPGTDQFHETMDLFKSILNHSNCIQISVPGYEADDVIATLARQSEDTIEIESNDADFLALVNDRVKVNRDPLPNTKPEHVHLYKTLVGDKSDGIKGLQSFGQATWDKLEDSEKFMLIKHFNNEQRLTGDDCKNFFGWTKGLIAKWDANLELLDQYWKVTEFFDVPYELIQRHLTVGTLNQARAQEILAPFMLDMNNEKQSA
ncbi:hypothetical protein [Pseudoalteromonas sp.]|uniref:hypothetical protein n=1 Tax=Pseudoalteromonas sp. TaxID=53249 RepID=UPI00272997CA|nr:hypothetical protein [Pseudoalteromonas sp.]